MRKRGLEFVVRVDCGGSAFDANASAEVARILRKLADDVECLSEEDQQNTLLLKDATGRDAGYAEFYYCG